MLATGVALSGCADDEGAETPAPVSAAPSSGAAEPSTTEEPEPRPEDTWADVEDPATMKVPLKSVDGVESVRVWEGSRFRVTPSAVIVAVPSPDRSSFQTLTLGSDTLAAMPDSEAEVRYWARSSGLLKGRAEVLDPVVVDGLELQHARGSNEVEIVDGYLYSDGEISYRVIFTTPLDYTEAQRDEAIGQVMATLEFE
jgi:hypothetical protein